MIARLASLPDAPPEPDSLQWGDELERGGFTSALAPEDFGRVARAAADMESGKIRAIVFTGRAGCGKTLAATIIARRLFVDREFIADMRRRFPCRDWGPYILKGYQVPQLEDDDQRRLTCFRTARCGNIVLDDIGTESPALVYGTPTDLVPEFLASFCDGLGFNSRCIVTTNLDGDGIRARYGERILSRLLETFAWLPFKGEDKREKKAMVY